MADLTGRRESRGLVCRIGRAGVVLLMTRVAQGAVQRVIAVSVAIGAGPGRHYVRAGQLKAGAGMVELAIRPLRRVVAAVACCRERCRNVIYRRQSAGVVLLMARVARRARKVVIVIDVAVGTLTGWHCVRAGQGKAGAVVIKCRVQPRRGVVALIATLREIRRHMVRVRRSLIVFQVTTHAGRSSQIVIVGHVAIGALPWRHGVHPG